MQRKDRASKGGVGSERIVAEKAPFGRRQERRQSRGWQRNGCCGGQAPRWTTH